jgi:hypothetical protein
MSDLQKAIKHFNVISKHKYYVMAECFKRGLYWQGIVHDLSKYSISEFMPSAKYFQGDSTPVAKMKAELGYAPSWLHHKGRNKHHWEYWTDFYDGVQKPCPIPNKYLIEMACDMIGASKAYLKSEYNPSEPLKYFEKNSLNWLATEETIKTVREILYKESIK